MLGVKLWGGSSSVCRDIASSMHQSMEGEEVPAAPRALLCVAA